MDEELITLNDVEKALKEKNFKQLRINLKKIEGADISEWMEELDIDQCIILFRLIVKGRRSEIFSFLEFDRQEEMLDRLPDATVVALLNEMEPVDRTRLLESLPQEISSKIILKLTPDERKIAWQLLSYPAGSVGRIMSPEFICLRSKMSVSESLDFIRWHSSAISESLLSHLFVIDENDKLIGYISLASLVVADPQSITVEALMETSVIALSVYESESTAVDFFRKYDRSYIPVLDDENILVGIVEAHDVFEVAEEDATEDIQQFGGQATLEESYFHTPVQTLLRKRAGWLAILFFGMLFTANALEYFHETIKSLSFLVFFLPLIISSGGNSGSQAASLMIRGLAIRELTPGDWYRVLSREIFFGLGLGIILGTLGYLRVGWWGQHPIAGYVVGLSLVSIVIFGAVVGSMLPFILKAVGMDPAVSSSPVIASLVDFVGIIVYFKVAALFIDF